MRQVIAGLGIVLAIATFATSQASAHVLITDTSNNTSAVLHITPDDDPEAGKPAQFYYELQTSINATTFDEYRLYVTDESSVTTEAKVDVSGNSMVASYTFPTLGLYRLELKSVNPWKQSFDLGYSLRVSRGVSSNTTLEKRYTWVGPTLVTVGVLFALLTVTFINNFKQIYRQSKL